MIIPNFYKFFLVSGALMAALSGCGSSNSEAPSLLGSQHSAQWTTPVAHGVQYSSTPDQCYECHGQDLLGGISKVSCSNACHIHSVPVNPNHYDWAALHGKQAKAAPMIKQENVYSGDTVVSGYAVYGFLTCQHCHGKDNKGSVLSHGQGCVNVACHAMAPHNATPPHSGFWNDKSNFIGATHTNVDVGNAAGCANCHNRYQKKHFWYTAAYKLYSTPNMLTPPEGAPAEMQPGCFNNTLCHGPK